MSGPVGVQGGIWPLAIPGPLLGQLGGEVALEHLDDVVAEDGEELPAVEGAACCDEESLCGGVWRDDEVGAGCECIPLCMSVTVWRWS